MKKCPNCGYIDYSAWRQNRWRTNVEFIQLDQFDNPEMLEKLINKSIETDTNYAYRISGKKKKVIERVLMEEYKVSGKQAFHIPREKVNHTPESIAQRKLTMIVSPKESQEKTK